MRDKLVKHGFQSSDERVVVTNFAQFDWRHSLHTNDASGHRSFFFFTALFSGWPGSGVHSLGQWPAGRLAAALEWETG